MMRMRMHQGVSARMLWTVGIAVLLLFSAVGAGANEFNVSDEIIQSLIEMPEGMLTLMQQYVLMIDAQTEPDTRRALLEDPHAWFEHPDRGVEIVDAVLWVIDLSLSNEDVDPWLFTSPYRGESSLQQIGVVLGGDNVSMFIHIAFDEASPGGAPDNLTQQALTAISWRPDEEWGALRTVVLDANAPGEDELKAQLLTEPRSALIRYDQRVSAAEAELSVLDQALAFEVGALYFGPIPIGMVIAPQALAVFGESVVLVYNTIF